MNERLLLKNLTAAKLIDKAIRENSLPHAILFISPDKLLLKTLIDDTAKKLLGGCGGCGECKSCKMMKANTHPDYFVYPKEKKAIVADDVDEIINRAYFRSFASSCKVFSVSNIELSHVAVQNKLLKIIEEPPENTYFLISVDNENNALQTVRSRSFQITLDELPIDLLEKVIEPDCTTVDEAVAISQVSSGSLERAYKRLKTGEKADHIELAFSVIESLKTTKDLYNTAKIFPQGSRSSVLRESMQNILPVMAMIYRDILCIKSGNEKDVSFKGYVERERSLSDNYSSAALIESIEKVTDTVMKLKFNTNAQSGLDSLLFELLEVKYNCPR